MAHQAKTLPGASLELPTWLAVATLVTITLIVYHGLWWPGLVLIKHDAFALLPIKQYMMERFSAGELPQWFPYEALGRPFIGATATGVFHPFTALYFLLPVPDGYRAASLISCLLAAVGAYTLGRRLNFTQAGALLAGAAFGLSGCVVSALDNLVYLYSLGVLPFFLTALEKALNCNRGWIIAPAVLWATVFLNGDVQTGYYYGFIALLWTLARAPGSYREAGLRLVLIVGLAALLAAIQLGPAAVVFAGSARSQPETFRQYAQLLFTHPLRLVTVVASPVIENVNPVRIAQFFFGSKASATWFDSLYLGVPVTGLAVLGAWYRRDLRILALLGLLAVLLAMGRFGGLHELFYQVVPLWSAFRYPEKLMGIASFAAAMLAGAGLDVLRAGKGWPRVWFAAALLCAGAGLVLQTEAFGKWTMTQFSAPPELTRAVTTATADAFIFSAAASMGMWLAIAAGRRQLMREALVLCAIVAIVTVDLAHVNSKAYQTGPAEATSFRPPLAEAIAAREGALTPGRFRLVSIVDFTYQVPRRIHELLGYQAATSVERRHALDVTYNTSFHLETVQAYLPGYSAALHTVLPNKLKSDLAARYNVVYYIGRSANFTNPEFANSLMAFIADYDLVLAKNPVPAKPRAYLSRQPERAGSPVDPAVLLVRPDFLDGEVDVIETPDATLPGPALGGSAVIERYAPEEVRVRVETPQPAALILVDAFEKGWTARLEDGGLLPILRANVLVRAVVVPAGTHLVTFSYQTPLLKAGAWASLVGFFLCIGLLVRAHQQRRSTESRA